MTTTNGGNGSDDGDDGGRPVGYKSPPAHGRIKKGEIRNPFGRNGRNQRKPDTGDSFEKVRRRLTRVTIDGETMMIPSDEAFYMVQLGKAMGGNAAAARIIQKELAARRDLGPPPPTLEDLAQHDEKVRASEELSQLLIDALEWKASMKRHGIEYVRHGLDGKPLPGSGDD